MVPEGAFVTANTVFTVFRKGFVAVYAVFFSAVLASPRFVRIFFMQFDLIII